MTAVDLDPRACYRAVAARDRSQIGRFYYIVLDRGPTGTVCQPGCRTRTPLPDKVRYVRTLEEALSTGATPCARCRPGQVSSWLRRDDPEGDLSREAMTRIRDGAMADIGVDVLAAELGTTVADLRRIVFARTGATPEQHELLRQAQIASGRDSAPGAAWPTLIARAWRQWRRRP